MLQVQSVTTQLGRMCTPEPTSNGQTPEEATRDCAQRVCSLLSKSTTLPPNLNAMNIQPATPRTESVAICGRNVDTTEVMPSVAAVLDLKKAPLPNSARETSVSARVNELGIRKLSFKGLQPKPQQNKNPSPMTTAKQSLKRRLGNFKSVV